MKNQNNRFNQRALSPLISITVIFVDHHQPMNVL